MAGIVPMRMESGDCVIASIATALQRPYESVASMLSVELDGSGVPIGTSWPWHPDQDPMVTLTDICRRLTESGALACLVADLPPAFIEMAVMGARCPAVLIVLSDFPADQGRAHALAYREGRIVDCRTATEDDRPPLAALMFLPCVSERSGTSLLGGTPDYGQSSNVGVGSYSMPMFGRGG